MNKKMIRLAEYLKDIGKVGVVDYSKNYDFW